MAGNQIESRTDTVRLNHEPVRVSVCWAPCEFAQTQDAILSFDERERAARFVHAEDRQSFVTAHALARIMLSRFAAVDPADWQFSAGEFGKPAISYPSTYSGLQFNLSHTRGLVACAVARDCPVGVDVEAITRQTDCAMLAKSVFSRQELAAWQSTRADLQQRNFFRYWTLKEAYIKACGLGLSLPLDSFSFTLSEDERPVLAIHAPDRESGNEWHFRQLEICSKYLLAVGLRTNLGQSVEFEIRKASPTAQRNTPVWPNE